MAFNFLSLIACFLLAPSMYLINGKLEISKKTCPATHWNIHVFLNQKFYKFLNSLVDDNQKGQDVQQAEIYNLKMKGSYNKCLAKIKKRKTKKEQFLSNLELIYQKKLMEQQYKKEIEYLNEIHRKEIKQLSDKLNRYNQEQDQESEDVAPTKKFDLYKIAQELPTTHIPCGIPNFHPHNKDTFYNIKYQQPQPPSSRSMLQQFAINMQSPRLLKYQISVGSRTPLKFPHR